MTQTETTTATNRIWSIHPQYVFALLIMMILAMIVHGIPVLGRDYPTGPDYGQMRFAIDILENGTLPANNTYFQMGQTEWGQLPGAPLLFALNASFSGIPVFEGINFILIFTTINAFGMSMLMQRIFKRMDVAIFAGMLTAIHPLYVDMMSWAAYPNIIALALFPFVLIIWFDYWKEPSIPNMIIAVFAICGTVYIHHLSTLWLGLSLVAFVIVELFVAPLSTLRKAIPIAIFGLLAGFPILLQLLDLFISTDATGILFASNRFDNSRVTWEWWSNILTPLALPFLIIGLTAFFKNPDVSGSIKRYILVYTLLTAGFIYGWLFGLQFAYIRAIFFLGIPLSTGAVAFYLLLRDVRLRMLFAIFVLATFAIYTYQWGQQRADFYEVLTPDSVRAMNWLNDNSEPDDVILVSTFYAFHVPHFVERPMIAALTPDLIGNPAEIEFAADAVAVLKGLVNMDDVLRRRNIRYILISASSPDVPEQSRSKLVLDAHPDIQPVFQTGDTLIYRVNRDRTADVSN